MRQLHSGHAGVHRHEALREALGERTDLSHHPAILVAPTRSAAHEFLRNSGDVLMVGVYRTSFWGLILDWATPPLAAEGRIPMPPLAEAALAARALSEKQTSLEYLSPVLTAPRLPKALAQTLDELRRAGVSPGELHRLGALGHDLSELAGAYEALLNERKLADATSVMDHAQRNAAPPMEGWPLFLLDVVPEDAAEAKMLHRIAQASETVVSVAPAEHPQLALLEEALECTAQRLPEPPPETRLARVQTTIFQATASEASAPPEDDTLVFFSAPGEAREAVDIARYILSAAETGTPFDRIGILLRDPSRYQPYVEDAFSRAAIPAFYTRLSRRPDPAGRALLALLACAEEGLSAERFAEYLSFGEVPQPDPDSGAPPQKSVPWVTARNPQQLVFFSLEPEAEEMPPAEAPVTHPEQRPVVDGRLAAPDRWERLLVEASVVGGLDRWKRRLHGLEAELLTKHKSLEAEQPLLADRLQTEVASLRHLRRFALPLIADLAELPRNGPWETWVEALERLATRALRAPERVLRVLAELRGLASVDGVDLPEVQRVLRPRLGYLQDAPEDDQPYGRVWVGHIDEAAGRTFELAFLPGLAEGGFPRPSEEDPLLHDRKRASLKRLPARRVKGAREERARLRMALGAAECTLVASYPRIDTEKGRPRVPSFYAVDILRAASGQMPSLEELAVDAQAPAWTGWPAPGDPEHAIDEAEYDLAVLAQHLKSGDEPASGQGRYLMEALTDGPPPNPHLVRSLYARAYRWRRSFGSNDGWVRSKEAVLQNPVLSDQRLNARPYSASALQHYAACPYRFYLSAILRLRPRDDLHQIEQMDPLIRGNLVHAMLFQWFHRISKEFARPWTLEDGPALLHHLAEAVDDVASAYKERLCPAIDTVWDREVEELHRDLQTYLRREIHEGSEFFPAYAELAFGLPPAPGERDPRSQTDPITLPSGYMIRGAIDLIEASTDGRLRITDYKTGRKPYNPSRGIAGGATLQPILYAQAAALLLNREVESSRLAFCTERGQFSSIYHQVGPAGVEQLEQALRTIDSAVQHEFLPAAPKEGACNYCDYRAVCGLLEEERIHRKEQEPLHPLHELRHVQ